MDATIPFHFHTKSIFCTHMLLSACCWQFHSWNLQIHVTSNSLSCDISLICMSAGSTPKLPVAGVAATCSLLQKLLVLHWCRLLVQRRWCLWNQDIQTVSQEYIFVALNCGQFTAHASHAIYPTICWRGRCETCCLMAAHPRRYEMQLSAGVIVSLPILKPRHSKADISCSTDSLGLMVDLNCWICQMTAGTDSCVRNRGQSSSMLPFIHHTGNEGLC